MRISRRAKRRGECVVNNIVIIEPKVKENIRLKAEKAVKNKFIDKIEHEFYRTGNIEWDEFIMKKVKENINRYKGRKGEDGSYLSEADCIVDETISSLLRDLS